MLAVIFLVARHCFDHMRIVAPNELGRKVPIFGMSDNPVSPCSLFAVEIQMLRKIGPKNIPDVPQDAESGQPPQPLEVAKTAIVASFGFGFVEKFYAAIRKYWPQLPDGSLEPDYAGIRPKLSRPGEANADFKIWGPTDHGQSGLVALLGIESPGLTASLAIADHVTRLLR